MLIEILSVLGLVLANVICYACHHKSLLRGKLQGPKLIFISNRLVSFSYFPISAKNKETAFELRSQKLQVGAAWQ